MKSLLLDVLIVDNDHRTEMRLRDSLLNLATIVIGAALVVMRPLDKSFTRHARRKTEGK